MLNVTAVVGRLVADPQLALTTPNGIPYTMFTIAVDRNFTNPSGQRQADFLDVTAWRSTAEFVCKYFKKGNLIAISGSLHTNSYQDKYGVKRKDTRITADKVSFAGSKNSSTSSVPTPPDITETDAPCTTINDDFSVVPTEEDMPS